MMYAVCIHMVKATYGNIKTSHSNKLVTEESMIKISAVITKCEMGMRTFYFLLFTFSFDYRMVGRML